MKIIQSLLLLLAIISSTVVAEEWNPTPPQPNAWDWIRLTSGEWLKGEFIALYDDELEFDSDELDELTFDWEDISIVRTGRVMKVFLLNGQELEGRLLLDGEEVRVEGSEQVFPRQQILTITGGGEDLSNYWDIKIGVGINVRSGNSDQVDVNNSIKLRRRTIANRFTLDYLANYSETENIETANNHRLTAAWDVFLTDRLFVRLLFGEYLKDPYQNIDYKYTTGMGVGYQVVDTGDVEWLLVAGPAYQKTKFETVEIGENLEEETPAFSVASNLDIEITSDVDFFYDYSFTFTKENAGKYTHHMVGGLEIDLGSYFDLDVSVVWDRTEKPQADENGIIPAQDDYRLIVGIGFDY